MATMYYVVVTLASDVLCSVNVCDVATNTILRTVYGLHNTISFTFQEEMLVIHTTIHGGVDNQHRT